MSSTLEATTEATDLSTYIDLLTLAARLDVSWYAGSMCRACGTLLVQREHATTCPMPDPTDSRRPLDVALPGDGFTPLSATAALAVELITGQQISTTVRGCTPLARAALRQWARLPR